MAYREVAMWEIFAVLERAGRGESRSAIARVTGHSRKTVRRYLASARELGWEPGRDPPTEALAGEVYRRHRPAKERGPGEAEAELLPHLEQLRSWLIPGPGEKRGLKLTKVQRLLERQGIRIPYSSLHRFAVKHCDFGREGRVTVRMAPCTPGELAEVDFGRLNGPGSLGGPLP
jgi:transposase